jgi:hypothetical protein
LRKKFLNLHNRQLRKKFLNLHAHHNPATKLEPPLELTAGM